jgi:hypothetical protein
MERKPRMISPQEEPATSATVETKWSLESGRPGLELGERRERHMDRQLVPCSLPCDWHAAYFPTHRNPCPLAPSASNPGPRGRNFGVPLMSSGPVLSSSM